MGHRTGARLTLLAAALAAGGLASLPARGAPDGGVVRAGSATIATQGTQTRIDQSSARAVIDWRGFSIGAAEQVLFVQPSAGSATLNRVTGGQASVLQGQLQANGQVFLVNPHGIVMGRGAELDVGGFIASTANIANADFMAGRLAFSEPGLPGAAIVNEGRITAAEGGLVALVAPHVRNDGLIQARLGKVALGVGEAWTLDLQGDGLVQLALPATQAGRLLTQAGRVEADGGQVLLVSAAAAKSALDQVINLSGTVRADTVAQQGGRILLLAGGSAEVSGQLSAQGGAAGQAGGRIEVLGDQVLLGATARLDASGAAGGGTVHVGGSWQGGVGDRDAPRATATTVQAGAAIAADARDSGRGGEVVVWADGHTAYAGGITARGGATAGDGGRVEVSGRRTLDFAGTVDAGAVAGHAGLLLLDPATLVIGSAEAGLVSRVLRTGTSTVVSATQDIRVEAAIDGRGRIAGGGLTLDAGRDIRIDEHIVTADGAIALNAAAGTVSIAADRGVFAGMAPISVRAGADLSTGTYVTRGQLSLVSTGGHVRLDTPLDATLGPVQVSAALDVSVNQPVVNLRNGSAFEATAGGNLRVAAQIDGRGGASGGAVSLTAGGSVHLDESVVTQGGAIDVRALGGSIVTAPDRGLVALGGGAISLTAGADFSTGMLATTGPISLVSTAGAVTIGRGIDATAGALTVSAATDVHIDTPVLNGRSGAAFHAAAGRDLFVRAPVDARGGVSGAAVDLSAGRDVVLADSVVTDDGAIQVQALGGTVAQAAGVQLRAGSAAIDVSAGAGLVTGSYVTRGALRLRSTGGSINVAEPIYDSTGATTLQAAVDVVVQPAARIENMRTGAPLAVEAGRDIRIDGQIGQDRDALTATGPVTLGAARDVLVNNDVVTRDAALTVSAASGTVTLATQIAGQPAGTMPQLRAGAGTLTVTAGSDLAVGHAGTPRPSVETPFVTTGALNVSSTGGTLSIEAPIPASTGRVTLHGEQALHVNERIYSNGQDITLTAGAGGIVMNTSSINLVDPGTGVTFATVLSDIDARAGHLTLTARGDINAPSVRTVGTLTITSTEGRITDGAVNVSRSGAFASLGAGLPGQVRLAGALGIDAFDTLRSPDVQARSSAGSVNLRVSSPQRLYVEAALDGRTGGFIGNAAEFVVGRDLQLDGVTSAGLVRVRAGQDFVLAGDARAIGLAAQAGRDIRLSALPATQTWIEGPGGLLPTLDPQQPAGALLPLRGLTLAAGRDLVVPTPVHVSDLLDTGVEARLQPTTLSAGRHLVLQQLQTIGDVALASTQGDVTVLTPLGRPVGEVAPAPYVWNPADLGLNTLAITASGPGATVDLQGARSQGNVAIAAPDGGTIRSAYAITSANGTVALNAPTIDVAATPIPPGTRLPGPGAASPVVAPGPLRAAPAAPEIPAAPAPGAPGLSEILVSAPAAIDAGSLAPPGQAGATAAEDDQASRLAGGPGRAGDGGDEAGPLPPGATLLFAGGRGIAQAADLGRSGNYGSARAPSRDDEDERRGPRRTAAESVPAQSAERTAERTAAPPPGRAMAAAPLRAR